MRIIEFKGDKEVLKVGQTMVMLSMGLGKLNGRKGGGESKRNKMKVELFYSVLFCRERMYDLVCRMPKSS